MSEKTPENGNGLPDSASSNRSREFWKIYPEDVQRCINGLRSSFYIFLITAIGALGVHYYQDGKTEHKGKKKIKVDAEQTEMYPQTPLREDFSQRESKFLE